MKPRGKKLILLIIVLFVFTMVWQLLGWNINEDNSIYIPGRKFYFEVEYVNNLGNVIKTEKLDLTASDGFYPERKQTQIIWELYTLKGKDTLLIKDKTGVVDSEERFFIHQPRIGDMKILSFADFPQFSTYIFKDTLGISHREGEVKMAKTFDGTLITKVKTRSKSKGKTSLSLGELGERRVFAFSSQAESELGVIKCDYFFDSDYGFVKMDFQLPDLSFINIELKNVSF